MVIHGSKKGIVKLSMTKYLILAALFVISLGSVFGAGYYFSYLHYQNDMPPQVSDPASFTNFLPGKTFFDDTVLVITLDSPRQALVATASRLEEDTDFSQNTRVSVFDGADWTRKVVNTTTENAGIFSNSLLLSWKNVLDPTRVLKETISGEYSINNKKYAFSASNLQNEIIMRSTPGYTKTMSEGNATLIIGGVSHPAKIVYTKIYSLNSAEIQFYDRPFGLTTNWLAYWGSDGTFYHVDKTLVDKPSDLYTAHQIGVMKSPDGGVYKTFSVNTSYNDSLPPLEYSITLGSPISKILKFDVVATLDKSPLPEYKWYLSILSGDNNGADFGFVEYIHD